MTILSSTASVSALTGVAFAVLMQTNPVYAASCQDLIAGQNQLAGSVCVDNNSEYLTVTYQTIGDWSLNEVHLFVGDSISQAPQTRSGNPQIGHFPYADSASGNSYTFQLPMGDFGDCDADLVIAAHAVVSRVNSSGAVQTETGWASGTRFTPRGNWATWFDYDGECDSVIGSCSKVETAFSYGDQTLQDLGTGINRWGWQITVSPYETGSQPLYAGAAQNNVSKGTLVGEVNYSFNGTYLDLTYVLNSGFGLNGTHVYAGAANISTGAPGQFGNQQSHAFGTNYANYYIDTGLSGSQDLFVVAHADVCFIQ